MMNRFALIVVFGCFSITALLLRPHFLPGSESPPLSKQPGKTDATKLALFGGVHLSAITGVSAEDGRSEDRIRIGWNDPNECQKFFIYRATSTAGPYLKIGQTKDSWHLDYDTEAGLKYWYRIQGYKRGYYTPLSNPDQGYRKMPVPEGMSLDDLVSKKNKRPVYNDSGERQKAAQYEKVLRPYYKNPIKLGFIILVAKFYVRRGDLKVLGDFYRFYLNKKNGSIYLIGKNAHYTYTVRLENNRFVRIASSWDSTLLKQLMNNAYFYCIYSGDREFRGNNGNVYMVPHFEAVGFTSEYYKNDINWKSKTVMFDSDNEQLDAMINSAGRWKTGK